MRVPIGRGALTQDVGDLQRRPSVGSPQTTLANAMEVAGCLVLKLPAMDSSRTDAACGHVDAENRKGKLFRCTACGRVDDADVNAARVMRQRALKWLARPSFGQVWLATSVSTTPGAVTAHWTDAPRMRCTSTRLAAIWQPETRGRFHLPHCPISGVHFWLDESVHYSRDSHLGVSAPRGRDATCVHGL